MPKLVLGRTIHPLSIEGVDELGHTLEVILRGLVVASRDVPARTHTRVMR